MALTQANQNNSLSGLTQSLYGTTGKLNPDAILRKGVYDKVAASVILKKYINFHNDPSSEFINDSHSDKYAAARD